MFSNVIEITEKHTERIAIFFFTNVCILMIKVLLGYPPFSRIPVYRTQYYADFLM